MGWIKNQIMALSLALSSVEKNALSQDGQRLTDDAKMVQRHTQGMLMDSLINGEVTEEVKLLRARLYKVTEATDKLVISSVTYDDDGNAVYSIEQKNHKSTLKKLKLDDFDDYDPELVVMNDPHVIGLTEGGSESVDTAQSVPLVFRRDFTPRFRLEYFTKKMVVRKIDGPEYLLELYISKYPKEFNVNSRLFVKFFEKEKENLKSQIFDINGIEFITEKNDIGVDDGFLYEFTVNEIDKIIEYDGNYVVKYKATLDNVEDIKDYFIHEELDEKYKNKERRGKN